MRDLCLSVDPCENMAMRQSIQSVHIERELSKIRKTQSVAGEVITSQARRRRDFVSR